jgi:hypothetical protein
MNAAEFASATFGLMSSVVTAVWAVPALLIGGLLLVALINAIKRGSNV